MTFGLPWSTWEPMYAAIVADLGFDRRADERARDDLVEHLTDSLAPASLPDARGRRVVVAGAGPNLDREIDRIEDADLVFAASTATAALEEAGMTVDVHVTDLDKDEETTVARTGRGDPVALHAHGDNRERLRRYLPSMDHGAILPTTQVESVPPTTAPGGFTDGDRAAFLAHALGAGELAFVGWDFDDPSVSPAKREKLRWAERLLHWLERRRSERFDVLDGRRAGIDIGAFPAPQ